MLCGRSTGATLLRTRSTVSGVESESGVGGEGIGTRLLLMMRTGNLDSSLIEDQLGPLVVVLPCLPVCILMMLCCD